MAAYDYDLLTRWELEATPEEVYDIIADAPRLREWWPAVHLDVQVLEPGDERGVGRVVDLRTKGRLPCTIRWRFRVVDARRPERLAIEATGDLAGLGVWTFEPAGKAVVVRFHWSVRAEKRLLRVLSLLLKPVFMDNHRWAMSAGYTSLLLEVWRRRAPTEEARAWLPKPPPPTFPHNRRSFRARTSERQP
jgi:uncharacterized protein YndB with AHSA1/START domain